MIRLSDGDLTLVGRTPSGVRGLKSICHILDMIFLCRTPSGVRGLKSLEMDMHDSTLELSHPVRGAWIEMDFKSTGDPQALSRTPSGVRGLKSACNG